MISWLMGRQHCKFEYKKQTVPFGGQSSIHWSTDPSLPKVNEGIELQWARGGDHPLQVKYIDLYALSHRLWLHIAA